MAAPPLSAPAVLPVTNVESAPPQTENQQLASARSYYAILSDTVKTNLSSRRPWPELVDRTAFSKPDSFSDATIRLRKNYNYFRINYLIFIACILAVSLLTNPLSLILLCGLLAAWLFLYVFRKSSDPPITIFGRQFSDREILGCLIVCTVVVIFLTSVGTVLVSALLIGVGIVALHGSFRNPEDLFLDEQEQQGGVSAFLSLLTPAQPPAAQPAAAARA